MVLYSAMVIELINTTAYALSVKKLQQLAHRALQYIHFTDEEVSVAVISEKKMQEVNFLYRGKNTPTDVVSFNYGEILLCPRYIEKKYHIKKVAVEEKMYDLFAHGLVHIAGYTHDTAKEAKEMEEIENKILRPNVK